MLHELRILKDVAQNGLGSGDGTRINALFLVLLPVLLAALGAAVVGEAVNT